MVACETKCEPLLATGTGKAKRTTKVVIQNWTEANSSTSSHIAATNLSKYEVKFKIKKDFGEPGALVVENLHRNEFLLKEIAVELPNHACVHFICDSCVYNVANYATERVFFANKVSPKLHVRICGSWILKLRSNMSDFRSMYLRKHQQV